LEHYLHVIEGEIVKVGATLSRIQQAQQAQHHHQQQQAGSTGGGHR